MANLDDPGYVQYSPSAGAPAPNSDITVAPGYTPDYGSLLQTDPSLVAAKSAADADQQTADAARQASVRSRFVQYGGDLPSGWSDKYGDLDQATQDAAKGNQFSTIAQMKDNYGRSVESFKRALAARGMLQSGELNYGQDQLDRGLGQQKYDAANAFASGIANDYGTYAGVLGQNARSLASAVGTAQGNVLGNPANRPVAPTQAHYDTASSAKFGKPVYSDAWGTLYDQYGNVLVQGTPPPDPSATGPAATDASSGGGYAPAPDDTSGGTYPNTAQAIQSAAAVTQPYSLASTDSALDAALAQTNAPYAPSGTWPNLAGAIQNAAATEYVPTSGYAQKSKANLH